MGEDGKKAIELALQGGGAHGAFTWGVLDRLLADDRLRIDAL
ncbi:MAG TPA: patatin-like phospholipase family protein, partial [Arenibaculum sp.]|nr:patatin-like phospholipase family protein [Arenibaculum sp.]